MALKTSDLRWVFLLGMILVSNALIAQQPAFDTLKDRIDSSEVFRADFVYIYTDSYTDESTSSSGAIWVNTTSYKLITTDQILVVDGQTSRVYDGIRNRVIVSEYIPEDDDFAPSRILGGIDETYSITEESQSDGTTLITMISDDDFADYISVELLLNSSGIPLRITATDFAENQSITRFTDGRFIRNSDSLFILSHPNDAEIIDMRQ